MDNKQNEQLEMEEYYRQNMHLFRRGEDNVIAMIEPEFYSCNALEKTLTLAFEVKKWELNPHGIMHGGIITTIVDTTFGFLSHFYARNKYILTIDIATSFLKPIPMGDTALVTARLNASGRTILSMTAEVRVKSSNVLAATATTTFYARDRK